MNTHISIIDYREGRDPNDDKARSHTYAETDDGLFPMCTYGWNRSNGARLSIIRREPGTVGECKLCLKNLKAGEPPVYEGKGHKTKYK